MHVHIRSNGDDWEALYIDGKKVAEDHSIRLGDFIRLLIKRGVISKYTSDEAPPYDHDNDSLEYDYEGLHFPEVLP